MKIKKTILIEKEQNDWIEDKDINLSKFIRKKIQREIDGQKK